MVDEEKRTRIFLRNRKEFIVQNLVTYKEEKQIDVGMLIQGYCILPGGEVVFVPLNRLGETRVYFFNIRNSCFGKTKLSVANFSKRFSISTFEKIESAIQVKNNFYQCLLEEEGEFVSLKLSYQKLEKKKLKNPNSSNKPKSNYFILVRILQKKRKPQLNGIPSIDLAMTQKVSTGEIDSRVEKVIAVQFKLKNLILKSNDSFELVDFNPHKVKPGASTKRRLSKRIPRKSLILDALRSMLVREELSLKDNFKPTFHELIDCFYCPYSQTCFILGRYLYDSDSDSKGRFHIILRKILESNSKDQMHLLYCSEKEPKFDIQGSSLCRVNASTYRLALWNGSNGQFDSQQMGSDRVTALYHIDISKKKFNGMMFNKLDPSINNDIIIMNSQIFFVIEHFKLKMHDLESGNLLSLIQFKKEESAQKYFFDHTQKNLISWAELPALDNEDNTVNATITDLLFLRTKMSFTFSVEQSSSISNSKYFDSEEMANLEILDRHLIFQTLPEYFPILSKLNFPFKFIQSALDEKIYSEGIEVLSEYYFSFLEHHDRTDSFFGPINPLLLCIFHKDTQLLSSLLDKYFYPTVPEHCYVSPLEYAFRTNNILSANTICEYALKKHSRFPKFNRRDLFCLLKANSLICHRVLSNFFQEGELSSFPKFLPQKKSSQFGNYQSVIEYLHSSYTKIDLHEDQSHQNLYNALEESSPFQNNKKNMLKEIETKIFTTKLDLSVSSLDMIQFQYNYSISPSEEFILSESKLIVAESWSQLWVLHFLEAFCFWLLNIFFVLFAILQKSITAFKWVSLGLSILNLCFEFIRMWSFSRFKPGL